MEQISIIEYIESDSTKWKALFKKARPILLRYKIVDEQLVYHFLSTIVLRAMKSQYQTKMSADKVENYFMRSIKHECMMYVERESKGKKVSLDQLKENGIQVGGKEMLSLISFETHLDVMTKHVIESKMYGEKEQQVYLCIARTALDGKKRAARESDYEHQAGCSCNTLDRKSYTNVKHKLLTKLWANRWMYL